MSYHAGNRGKLEREERRKGRRKEDEKAKKEKNVRNEGRTAAGLRHEYTQLTHPSNIQTTNVTLLRVL